MQDRRSQPNVAAWSRVTALATLVVVTLAAAVIAPLPAGAATSPTITIAGLSGSGGTFQDNATFGTQYQVGAVGSDDSTATYTENVNASSNSVCSMDQNLLVTFASVGICEIILKATIGNGSIFSSDGTATLDITVGQATTVVTVNGTVDTGTQSGTATYGTPYPFSYSSNDPSATPTAEFSPSSSAVCSGNVGATINFTSSGHCVVTVTSNSTSGNYTNAAVTYDITVGKIAPAITVNGRADTGTLSDAGTYGTAFPFTDSTSDPTATLSATFNSLDSSVCKGTVGPIINFLAAGQCQITVTSTANSASGYTSSSVTYNITVGTIAPAITVNGRADTGTLSDVGTYGTVFPFTDSTSDPTATLSATFNSLDSSVCTGTVSSAIEFLAAGQCQITVTSTTKSPSGYKTISVTYIISVSQIAPVISVGTVNDAGNLSSSATFGAPYTLPNITTSDLTASLAFTFDPSSSAVCSGTVGKIITFAAAGTCIIHLTSNPAAVSGYTSATVTLTITVGPQSSSISVGGVTDTGNVNSSATYGTPYTVPAFTTNDPSVLVKATFSPSSSAVCSGAVGTTITFAAAGTCVIDLVTSSTSPNFTATSATLTVIVQDPTKVGQTALLIIPEHAYVKQKVHLATTGGSGSGVVTYKIVGGTAKGCAISGSSTFTLSARTAGTCVVRATKATDLYFLPASSPLETFRFQVLERFRILVASGGVHTGAANIVNIKGTGLLDAHVTSGAGVAASIVVRTSHVLRVDVTLSATVKPGRHDFVVENKGTLRLVYFTLTPAPGSNVLHGHVSLKPQVVPVRVAQAALSLSDGRAKVGASVVLRVRGGSGSGAVTMQVVGGTAKGCAVTGAVIKSVHAAGPGTCVVVASKAGDATHRPVASSSSVFTFVAPPMFAVTSVSGTLSAGATSDIELHGRDFLAGGHVTVSNSAFAWHAVSGSTTELTLQIDVATSVVPGVYVLTLQSKAGGVATVYLVMTKSASGRVTGYVSLSK